jgi:hypothetical protein
MLTIPAPIRKTYIRYIDNTASVPEGTVGPDVKEEKKKRLGGIVDDDK